MDDTKPTCTTDPTDILRGNPTLIPGVDTVAGDPAVPLSVWRGGGICTCRLARQILDSFTRPGHAVVDFRGDRCLRVVAGELRITVTTGTFPALVRAATAPAWLAIVGWPRLRPRVQLVELLRAVRRRLAPGGHAVVTLPILGPGMLDAHVTGPLITAARAAGLGYLQDLVLLDPPGPGRPGDHPAPRPWRPAHRRLPVLVAVAGRDA
jgi:hypothetical protein